METDNIISEEIFPIYRESLRIEQFVQDALRPVSKAYVGFLFLSAVISSGIYFLTKEMAYGSIWPNQFVFYTVLIVHICFRLSKSRDNILSPEMFFLLFYTLFHLGYITLFSLGLVPLSSYIFFYEASIPKAMYVTNLGLIGFLIGWEIMGCRGGSQRLLGRTVPRAAWEVFGAGLLLFSIVIHFVGLTLLGWGTILNYGYDAIQNLEKYTTYSVALLLQYSNPLMVIGMILAVLASVFRHQKMFHSKIVLLATIFCFFIMVMEGERGTIVKLAVPLLLIRHFFVKRIKYRYLLVFLLTGFFLFAFMGMVRTIVFRPQKMMEEYRYQKSTEESGWKYSFVSMGSSFLIVDIVTHDIPSRESYWYGASWRSAVLHMVPFLQGFLARLGYAERSPSQWITSTYFGPGAAGRAFTVAAEGYLNFGFVGVLLETAFIGAFIRWLTIFFSRRPSAFRALIFLGCLVPAILITRNHMNLLLAPCAQIIVGAWILNVLLRNEYRYEQDLMDIAVPYGCESVTYFW